MFKLSKLTIDFFQIRVPSPVLFVVVSVLVSLVYGPMSFGQENAPAAPAVPAGGGTAGLSGIMAKTQNDLMVVSGAGVAGAVLGLSTLSFVDQPEKHLRRIVTGGAIGLIAGVIYVAYRQATASALDVQEADMQQLEEPPAGNDVLQDDLANPTGFYRIDRRLEPLGGYQTSLARNSLSFERPHFSVNFNF